MRKSSQAPSGYLSWGCLLYGVRYHNFRTHPHHSWLASTISRSIHPENRGAKVTSRCA